MLGRLLSLESVTAADLQEEDSFWQQHWLLVCLTSPFKMFFKNSCSKWKCWSRIPMALFIGGKMEELFFNLVLTWNVARHMESNWVEQCDRTKPLTSENWTWPKNLLQVCFHEPAALFFWAGRTDLVQSWLLAVLWSQFPFVWWDGNV